MVAEVAVCITGQARTLVAQQLHVSMRANLLDPLGADAFMHVAVHDTRAWGVQRASNSKELAEAARVLRPVSMQAESLLPPTASTRCAAQAAGGGGRSCLAHDCGTFSCGCYVPSCTHCEGCLRVQWDSFQEPPPPGKLDINVVRDSTYFFS